MNLDRVIESYYPDGGLVTAGPGRRLAAYLIDLALLMGTLFIGWIIWFAIVAPNGQTPGKQMLGMYIMKSDGSRAGGGYTWLRELVLKGIVTSVLSSFTIYIYPLIAGLWCTWDKNHQCLWDKMGSTFIAWSPRGYRPLTETELRTTGQSLVRYSSAPAEPAYPVYPEYGSPPPFPTPNYSTDLSGGVSQPPPSPFAQPGGGVAFEPTIVVPPGAPANPQPTVISEPPPLPALGTNVSPPPPPSASPAAETQVSWPVAAPANELGAADITAASVDDVLRPLAPAPAESPFGPDVSPSPASQHEAQEVASPFDTPNLHGGMDTGSPFARVADSPFDQAPESAYIPQAPASPAEQLRELTRLRDSGVLSEVEYRAKLAELSRGT